MDDFKDERFKGVIKDPRFKKVPSKHPKTKLDKRIRGMFSDKRFNLGSKVDKRGLPLITKDHQKFYQQGGDQGESESSSEDENSTGDLDEERGDDLSTDVKFKNDLPDDEHKKDEESDDGTENKKSCSSIKKPSHIDGSDEEGDSTSTETDFSDSEQEEEIDHRWQELDADAPRAENITRRLAVCNMDWDRLRAEDFLVVFNSFKPPDGVIHSVKIYPSEFGLERMEEEKLHGPAELIKNVLDSTEGKATNSTQDSQFHREKLRQYQINRLKYYFAVVDCDSPRTADSLYNELNGMEFESSGCILDLRFIPDDMIFTQESISIASSISCPADYKPTHFVTSALNQIKVDLTWDETDPRRKQVLEKAFTDPESIEKDLKEYLASPSESSEDETEELEDSASSKKLSCKEAIAKYKALLQTVEEKEKGQDEEFDMEITWDSGLKEKTEQLVKEKSLKETLTPFEEKLQKRKEQKKMKKEPKTTTEQEDDDISSSEEFGSGDITDDEFQEKVRGTFKGRKKNKVKLEANSETDEKKLAELALLVAEPDEKDSDDSDDGDNKKKKKKWKKKKKAKGSEMKEDSSQGYIDDPRFAEMYTSHLYHVDPAEQKFKQKAQIFNKAAQRNKYGDSDSAVTPSEILKKETDVVKDSKVKGKKSIKIEALKEKLTPFFKEFQKKKESLKLEKQNQSLQEGGCENLSGSLLEASNSKKQKKKKQKAEKPKFREDNIGGEMSTSNGTTLNSSASRYLEDNDDSDILIFSRDSTKKRPSSFSSDSPHTNSVRKKFKKNRVS